MNNRHFSNGDNGGNADQVHLRKQEILRQLIVAQGRNTRTRRIRKRASWVAAIGVLLIASASFISSPAPVHHESFAHHGAITANDVPAALPKSERHPLLIVRTDPELARSVVVSNSQLDIHTDLKVVSDEELAALMAEFRPDFFVAKIGGQQRVVPKKPGRKDGSP